MVTSGFCLVFLIYNFTGVFGLLQPLKSKIYLIGLVYMATALTLRRDVIMLEYVHFRISLG